MMNIGIPAYFNSDNSLDDSRAQKVTRNRKGFWTNAARIQKFH